VFAFVVAYTDGAYTDGARADDARDGRAEAVGAVQDALARVGCEADGWWVDGARYGSLDCADAACCPPDGHPVADLKCTRAAAQLVLEGSAPAQALKDLGRIAPASKRRRELARRAAARYTVAAGSSGFTAQAAFAEWLGAIRRAQMCREQPASVLGRLGEAMTHVEMMDLLLLWLAPGGEAVAEAASSRGTDKMADETAAAVRALVERSDPSGPDRERLTAAIAVLEGVCAHATSERTAAALAMLAFLAWMFGNGAKARLRAEAALSADPSCRVARIVEFACLTGLPPAWVRAR
jgi:hypothetical protein